MNSFRSHRQSVRSRQCRRGAAVVECAAVAPLMILFVFAAIDIGQFINTSQIINDASREGARRASRNTVNDVSEVEAAVQTYLADTFPGIPASELNAALTITVRDSSGNTISGGNLAAVPSGSQISVEVSFTYSTIRWLNGIPSVSGQSLATTTIMRRD